MNLYYTDTFAFALPTGNQFPMAKYARLRARIQESGQFDSAQLRIPAAATDEQLLLAHDADYVDRVVEGNLDSVALRRLGFPWSPELVERSRRSVGATIAVCRDALAAGIAASLAGGTHHAFADRGEGYCVFNDVVVAVHVLRQAGLLQRAVVLDCDAHQGNGTAALAAEDADLFTFSIHSGRDYPARKVPGDLDIALPRRTGDAVYLTTLETGLNYVERKVFRTGQPAPQLAIYVAGADPYREDRLGGLGLSKEGLVARDRRVFDWCRQHGLPLAITLGGGYCRDIELIVDVHFHTMLLAQEMFCSKGAD